MHSRVSSIIEFGFTGIAIDIECNITNGLPGIVIVGYGNRSVDEARERLRAAFANSKLRLPRQRIALNLAPGDIPKDGTSFDVAMAVAIFQAYHPELEPPTKTLFVGELGLDGKLRPIRGIVGKILSGYQLGFTHFVIPSANYEQAAHIPNVQIIAAESLQQVIAFCQGQRLSQPFAPPLRTASSPAPLLDDVIGQERAKRALQIAAAGRHNLLFIGPPGTGKSLLAKTLPSLLPPLTPEESLEVTHLHSLTEPNYQSLITERPFRTPHHSASSSAITGGGARMRPGEVSLSHHGVLFLDELPEFNRTVIEALRQPLEDQTITLTRAQGSVHYPANCMLVGTANPCPCGFYGTEQTCSCSMPQRLRYQQRISGPLSDRIDLTVHVNHLTPSQLENVTPDSSSSSSVHSTRKVRSAILQAFQAQHKRHPQLPNSRLNPRHLKTVAVLDTESTKLLTAAARRLKLSPRSYHKVIRVARTIADLEGSHNIQLIHLTEALQYRLQQ